MTNDTDNTIAKTDDSRELATVALWWWPVGVAIICVKEVVARSGPPCMNSIYQRRSRTPGCRALGGASAKEPPLGALICAPQGAQVHRR
jgi:hypothetical protein